MKTKKTILLILSIICLWNANLFAQGNNCSTARAVKTEDGAVDYSFQPGVNAAWFSFNATGPNADIQIGRVISPVDTPFAAIDSLVIYSGGCGTLTSVGSSIKRGGGPFDSLPAAQALGIKTGQTYYVKVTRKLNIANTSHFCLRPIHIITGPIIPTCSLPLCGPNLLCNGDFENTPAWATTNAYQDNSYTYTSTAAVAPESGYCISSPNMRYDGNNFIGTVSACGGDYDFTDMYCIGTNMFSNTAHSGSWFMAIDAPSDECFNCSSTSVPNSCTGNTLNTPNYTCIPWQENVTVIPGRTYTFETWIRSIDPTGYNGATVSMNINGALPFFQDIISPMFGTTYSNWTHICYNWTAPTGVTNALIQVVGQGSSSLQGYDFGLDDFSFGLSALPTITLNAPSVCPGVATTLTASPAIPGASYIWSTGVTTTSNSISVTTSSTATYSVQVWVGKCEQTATTTVTVIPPPIICIADSQKACPGGCVNINTACRNTPQPNTYVWSPAAGLSATTGGYVTACPTVNTVYTVVATNTVTGCKATATSAVTFYASSPAASTLSSVVCGSNCNGTVSVWATGGTSPYTYSWLPGGATTASASGLCAGTYTATVYDANGCSTTATAAVTSLAAPTITATSASMCAGGSATICATSSTGTYNWNTGLHTSCITVSPASTTVYTVTASTKLCSASATATVTVNPNPTLCTKDTVALCPGYCDTLRSLCGKIPFNVSYSWSPAASISSGANSPTAIACPTVSTVYTVTATNASTGCFATGTTAVEILPHFFTISGPTTVLCGNPYTYSISPVLPGCTYEWVSATGAGYGTTVTITPTASGSIQWVVRGPQGCEIDAILKITCGMIRGVDKTNALTDNSNVLVYPNPAGELVNIKLELQPNQQLNMCMYNNLGEVIKCETITENVSAFSTSMLPSGIYFYRITDTNGTLVKSDKLMIAH